MVNRKYEFLYIFILAIIMYFVMTSMGCSSIPENNQNNVIQPKSFPTQKVPKLSWEQKEFQEREKWSLFLISKVDQYFNELDKAKDIHRFSANYKKLTKENKIKVWAELFVAIAYYESGWRPKDSTVDVGNQEDKNTYSVGLFSVSQSDIKNYKLKDLKYTYEDLLKPEPNIDLAVRLMVYQLQKNGLIIQPSRKYLYWVTLYPSIFNRYDQTEAIINKVKKNTL